MRQAISAAAASDIEVVRIPEIYPSGGEDQLVQLVANREVPSGGLPIDAGFLVQNVGTAAAIFSWIVRNEPLISRVTTVTGDGVANPVNVEARLGTTVAAIIEHAGGYTERAQQLIIGGPMTGRSVTTDRVPLRQRTIDSTVRCALAGSGSFGSSGIWAGASA